jgi:hypothetical protein
MPGIKTKFNSVVEKPLKKKWQIVSFVGNTKYFEVEYRFENNVQINERFFGVALTKNILKTDTTENGSVLFICTNESYQMHSEVIKDKMNELSFKEGDFNFLIFSENNIKTLFSQLFDYLKEKEFEKLYLDITNTFRDIPFLLYPEILFFKERFNIDMEVVYARGNIRVDGFFKAEKVNSSTEIIEWLFATRMFIKKGDGSDFSKLLMKRYEKEKSSLNKKEDFKKVGNINKMAKFMHDFSTHFNSVDPYESGKSAYRLLEIADNFKKENVFEYFDFPWVIKSMLNQIIAYLEGIKLNFKTKKDIILNSEEIVRQQKILKWYLEIEDYKSALVFIREFIINCYLYANDYKDFLDFSTRDNITKNITSKFAEPGKIDKESLNEFDTAWNKLSTVRNYLSHCGNKQNSFPKNYPETYIDSLKILSEISCQEIREILKP